jgi:hypothetical protein
MQWDMFMGLAAQYSNVKDDKLFLVQYYTHIPELTLLASVNKVNKLRNLLKHNGIIPAKIEIEDACAIGQMFFTENTQLIFKVGFDEVSMMNLVVNDRIREFLLEGEQLLKEKNFEKTAVAIAKAYFHLLLLLDARNPIEEDYSVYETQGDLLIKDWEFYAKGVEEMFEGQEEVFTEEKTEDGYVRITEGMYAIASRYKNNFNRIFESLDILSYGVDYKAHRKYKSFMPIVISCRDDYTDYQVAMRMNSKERLVEDNIIFAIDFVLNFALKLQG